MDYIKEEFIQLLEYKKNIMTLNKNELRERYSTKEEYSMFLEQTLRVLDNECVIYLLDDAIKDRVYDIINHFRFIHKDPSLNQMSNEIIGMLNGLNSMTPERENDVIDEYICMHEDIRLLEFDSLDDFIATISKDYDTYVGLKTDDTSLVDDVSFLGAVTFFIAVDLGIMTPEMYQTAKERCQQIEKSKGLDLKKIKLRKGAKFTLDLIKEQKNQS